MQKVTRQGRTTRAAKGQQAQPANEPVSASDLFVMPASCGLNPTALKQMRPSQYLEKLLWRQLVDNGLRRAKRPLTRVKDRPVVP